MSGGSQLPVSALIRQGNQLDDVEGKRRSKDEYRRQKDLEEQRKAGQAPAMVDVETGRDINPHIPEFIEKTPWYVPTAGPTLKHQRPHPEREKRMASITDWFPKGTTNKVAFKYREGACENCGAMGHKKKECFERPRAVGAKFTDEVVAADDYVLPNLKMDYDAKRDRWNGYDPAEYKKVHEEYEQMEEARKLIRAQNMKDGIVEEGAADGGAGDGGGDEALKNDEDYYAEDMAPAMSVDMDSRTRITVRNLRIREDTAKYLYSLDENSAHYDPKSRSMRENPFENMPGKEKEAAKFSGENFVRYTGEVVDANEAQVFAWQARCQGIDVHALAEPTKLEALKRAYEEKKTEHKGSVTKELLDKYGGQEHLDAPQKELLLAQTENYVEYNRKGKVVKGEERPTVKSRYDEDVFINNHTSVWGSYWRDGQWGFKCCHSLFKNSYCIGEKGLVMEKAMIADGPKAAEKAEKSEQSKATNAADLPSASSTKESTVKEDATMVVDEDEKEPKEKRKKKGSSCQEHNSASSLSSSESASEGSGSSSEEDNESRDEEEIEREKEKRGKQEKRLETRREKRRRQKERRKNRPKTSSKDKRKAKRREERKLEKKEKRKQHRRDSQSSSSSSSSSSPSDSASESGSSSDVEASTAGHKKKSRALSEAIRKIEKQEEEGRKIVEQGDRKRKYNTNYEEVKPSAVETEAYHLTRIHASDPMAALMGEAKKTRKQ